MRIIGSVTEVLEKLKGADEKTLAETLKAVVSVEKEDVKTFIEGTDEGKQFAQSFTDARVNSGVETALKNFKEKQLPSLIEAEKAALTEKLTKELKPELTEEQKELRKVKEEQDAMRRELARNKAEAALLKKAAEKGVGAEFVDFVISDDIEKSSELFDKLTTIFSTAVDTKVKNTVDETFKKVGYNPDNPSKDTDPNKVTKERVDELKKKAEVSRRPEDIAAYSAAKTQLLAETTQN